MRTTVRELLGAQLADGSGAIEWNVPHWAFRPDNWSEAFLRGLRCLEVAPGKKVWEVGVGTGINLLFLTRWLPAAEFCISDWNPECAPLALENLERAGAPLSRIRTLSGQWDLVASPGQASPAVDVLVACIPQVPVPVGVDLMKGDKVAHYYDPRRYPESELHGVGLGLVDALLARAPRVLNPGGRVVLNLGGRPGLRRLNRMFRSRAYEPSILHEEVLRQHPETSLEPFALAEEASGTGFEFFADQHGRVELTARQAESLRRQNGAVFHKIYVIEGRMA